RPGRGRRRKLERGWEGTVSREVFSCGDVLPRGETHAAPAPERPRGLGSGTLRSMNALNVSAERLEHLRHLEAHLCEQIRGQDQVIPPIVPPLHRGDLGQTSPLPP